MSVVELGGHLARVGVHRRFNTARLNAMSIGGKVRCLKDEDGRRVFVVAPAWVKLSELRKVIERKEPPAPSLIPAGFNVALGGARRPCGPRKALEVVRWLREGQSPSTVAARLGLPRQTVALIRRQFRIPLPLDRLIKDSQGEVEGEDALRAAKGIAIGVVLGLVLWDGLAHLGAFIAAAL